MSDPPFGTLICDDLTTEAVCDCCHRLVRRTRGSHWHGGARICIACFYVWYDEGIVDPAVLGPTVLKREAAGKWPFPDPALARLS
jgi:hypothetical protein